MFYREREEEKDIRKVMAGAAIFVIALIVFSIPNLFHSVSTETLETIEIVVYLLIYLGTAHDVVVGSIKNVFMGQFQYVRLGITIVTLVLFFAGMYSMACAVILVYMTLEYFFEGRKKQSENQ